jgi:dihydroflavonol-4-reductase
MKVLVTGSNGFLGAWLTRRLMAEGHEVSALVRKTSDLSELENARPNFVYGDVTDKPSLLSAFREQEVVFHAAGVIGYRESDLPLMQKVNITGTQNVVDACAEAGVPQLLHVSSVVTVGASAGPVPLNESSHYNVGHLKMGYFETKRRAEEIVLEAVASKKIKAICVNPSTIYGSGDARKGSRKNQIKVARGKFLFYTAGGVNVVAVEDVVDGILSALQKGKNGERYILASENMTIKSLFQKIAACAGVKPPPFYMPTSVLKTIGYAGDLLEPYGVNLGLGRVNALTATMFHWFDHGKAQADLGFKPRSADIAIENSVQWMKDNGYLK